jgi:HAMP domain-containing protein
MTDVAFVAGAYLLAVGTLAAYAATLVRRLGSARSARAAIDAQDASGTIEAATQPQPR